jgi:hypothetical protein
MVSGRYYNKNPLVLIMDKNPGDMIIVHGYDGPAAPLNLGFAHRD